MNNSDTTSTRFPWMAMLTFGFAVFSLVTSEFLPTGMLPSMVEDLGVSTSQVGFLVTIWAGTVVLTAIPMSFLTRRFARKNLLVVAVVLFMVSNVLAATAAEYPMLVASRVVGGVGNGMFWMIATGYITSLLPARQR
jgi:predicted MFS family arabinose efflux permease